MNNVMPLLVALRIKLQEIVWVSTLLQYVLPSVHLLVIDPLDTIHISPNHTPLTRLTPLTLTYSHRAPFTPFTPLLSLLHTLEAGDGIHDAMGCIGTLGRVVGAHVVIYVVSLCTQVV